MRCDAIHGCIVLEDHLLISRTSYSFSPVRCEVLARDDTAAVLAGLQHARMVAADALSAEAATAREGFVAQHNDATAQFERRVTQLRDTVKQLMALSKQRGSSPRGNPEDQAMRPWGLAHGPSDRGGASDAPLQQLAPA